MPLSSPIRLLEVHSVGSFEASFVPRLADFGRLDERFRVLTSGSRLALPRHQTLRAALDWSHGLLTPLQQTVFRRLGVFVGSFALEAAQQVVADESIDEWAVLDALGSLVDKSLVVAEARTTAEPRYRLLETMRQYALEQLESAADSDATRTRHLDVFVALAEQARSELLGPRQAQLMKRLDFDFENMLAAHAWCDRLACGGERDLRLVTSLHRYWLNRYLISLGHRVTQEALRRTGAEGRNRLRREALTQVGRFAVNIGMYDQGMQAHDEAIDIAREIGAREILADALAMSGLSRIEAGDPVGGRVQIEEAFGLSQEVGTESEAFRRAAVALGEVERLEGNWTRAESLYEAALAQARLRGDLRAIAITLTVLLMNAIAQGKTAGVRERLLELVAVNEGLSTNFERLFLLILCAGLAALRGHWEQSARFEGVASFHFAQQEWPLNPADKAYVESLTARTRAALGDAAFERLRAAGRRTSLGEAFAQMWQYLKEEA